ncbi:MAG: TolC family outer membrane protein [Solirubrobacterales bacterium]
MVDELRGLQETHPQIQSKHKATLSAEQGIRSARAGYLPSVRTTADSGPEYVDNPTRRQTNGEPYYKGRETAAVVVTQHLFDGFLTDSSVDAAKVSREISHADLRATRQSTLLEGAIAYINVQRYTRLIQLSRENERKVQEQLNLEDERVQKGAGIASDVLAAKQRLQIAKERRVQFEGNFQEAAAAYTQVFGHAPEIAALTDPPFPDSVLPKSLDEALGVAEKENPSVETAARTVDLTAEKKRGAESGYYPTIDLIGRADYENDKNALTGVRRDWSLLLTANWELFSGFKTDATVAQASYDHAASKDNQNFTGRKVAEQVRRSWHQLKVARDRTALLDNAAILAEEVWEARKKQREAGKATVQEVLDEETRINDARINYTVAYFDMIQHAYELLNSMGRLEVGNVVGSPPAPRLGDGKTGGKTTYTPAPWDKSSLQAMADAAAAETLAPGINPGRYRR